jgi:hypothetical protein
MKKSSYSLIFVSLSMLTMLAVAALNYLIDPLMYYHAPWTVINVSNDHRHGNPGLARQLDYRIALLGTSHIMELESARLGEIMGEPSLNLPINAGLIREQVELAKLVLRQGKAHTILWEMNFPSFSAGDQVGTGADEFPSYLYKPTVETPFRYLLSFDTLLQSRKALQNPGSVTLDNRNQQPVREYSQERVLRAWDFYMQSWTPALRRIWIEYQKKVESPELLLETQLLPLFRQYPEVEFKLFLPPSSVMFFLLHESMGNQDFAHLLAFRNALARISEQTTNAQVYDFQADFDTIMNLDLFRDLEHYNEDVLENMFVQMRQGANRVDRARMEENTRQLKMQVHAYGKMFCGSQPQSCPDTLLDRLGLPSAASSGKQQ